MTGFIGPALVGFESVGRRVVGETGAGCDLLLAAVLPTDSAVLT